MSIDAAALLGGAVGGAAVQSVLGPLFGQRHLRRDLRANVLRGIARLESARWANVPGHEFRDAVIGLRAAVLVAGLSARPAERYIEVTAAARAFAGHTAVDTGSELPGGYIPGPLSNLAKLAASDLVALTWHPYRSRPFIGMRGRRFENQKAATIAEIAGAGESWFDWATVWIPG